MRNLAATIGLLLLGCARAGVAPTPGATACPPADSLYTSTPLSPLREPTLQKRWPRYATYVIDSTYVIANQLQTPDAKDGARGGALASLSADDIESIYVVKAGVAGRWNRCEGVPTIMIHTKGGRWRAPTHGAASTSPHVGADA